MAPKDERPAEVDLLRDYEERLASDVATSRPTCSSCLHWRPYYGAMRKIIGDDGVVSDDGSGQCTALPPSVPPPDINPGEPGFAVFWDFPDTASGQSCGMWQIREWDGNRTRLNPSA